MNKTAAIVQARYGSGRLAGKVLLPLPTGRTVLEEVLFRCQAIPGIDVVVAAVSNDPGSDPLMPFCAKAKHARNHHWRLNDDFVTNLFPEVVTVRGPEDDLIKRHILAANAVGATTILRVTSDCPLIDPMVCGEILRAYDEEDADYSSNILPQTWPHGYDCEVFSLDLLRRADRATPRDAEHVSTWMQTSDEVRRVNVARDGEDVHSVRLTLDTADDYTRIYSYMQRRIYELGGGTLARAA
jgi:glutamate-1-semialdehyde 2,1-aminomutase/spore coat polysaccharide biosynthesis protein SpsF